MTNDEKVQVRAISLTMAHAITRYTLGAIDERQVAMIRKSVAEYVAAAHCAVKHPPDVERIYYLLDVAERYCQWQCKALLRERALRDAPFAA